MIELKVTYKHPSGKIKTVVLDNRETWKLVGECNKCGECCQSIRTPELTLRGKEKEGCKYLRKESFNDKQEYVCSQYWIRPHFCLLYPNNPLEELPEKCSYKWEKIDG